MISPDPESAAPVTRGGSFDIEITHHDVVVAGLPPEMRGATIVQISDLHRGNGDADPLIREAIRLANALEPEFICLTGDYIDHRVSDILPAVRLVSCLRARQRVFAVIGNHDHRGDPILLASALEAAGITVLDNAALELVPGFWMAGIDDIVEGKPDIEAVLEPIPATAPGIFLTHRPNALDRIDPARPLVLLAGHTHGGQLVLPFPTPWMICRFHLGTNYVHGWYRRGEARMYVNRGIGVTGPRFLARRRRCPSEVSVFRLVAG